jgi:hypothetical protein
MARDRLSGEEARHGSPGRLQLAGRPWGLLSLSPCAPLAAAGGCGSGAMASFGLEVKELRVPAQLKSLTPYVFVHTASVSAPATVLESTPTSRGCIHMVPTR